MKIESSLKRVLALAQEIPPAQGPQDAVSAFLKKWEDEKVRPNRPIILYLYRMCLDRSSIWSISALREVTSATILLQPMRMLTPNADYGRAKASIW